MRYRPIRNSARFAPGPMQIRTCAPPGDLAPYVQEFWQMQVPPSVPPVPNQIYPSGAIILRFNITDHDVEAILYGPSLSSHMRGLFFPNVTMFGTALHPVCGYALLGMPASEVADLRVLMDVLWPALVPSLRQRLGEARSFGARVAALTAFLRAVLAPQPASPSLLEAFSALVASEGDVDSAKHASSAPVSARTLRRQFTHHVGLSPKEMARVIRFQRVLADMACGRPVNFAALAQRRGYSDQAHLVRDFASLMGVPPGRYLAYADRLQDPTLPIWAELSAASYALPSPPVVSMR